MAAVTDPLIDGYFSEHATESLIKLCQPNTQSTYPSDGTSGKASNRQKSGDLAHRVMAELVARAPPARCSNCSAWCHGNLDKQASDRVARPLIIPNSRWYLEVCACTGQKACLFPLTVRPPFGMMLVLSLNREQSATA